MSSKLLSETSEDMHQFKQVRTADSEVVLNELSDL